MKVIRNRILPLGRNLAAINLFGIIFAKHGVHISPRLLNHEALHTRQMRELLYVPFYIIYVAEWLGRLIQHHGKAMEAYRAISFEREAYLHDSAPDYLTHRRHFAQWRKI